MAAADAAPASPGKVPRRKYKRHPKPDTNAPDRPLTAYVRFSKDKRREYQDRRLSFSELAKQIGIDWQDLSPTTKNKYLSDASTDWTNFRKHLDDYHATPQYAEYVQYLRDFASENPDSAVKVPQPDGSTSPSQAPPATWDAEGSPASNEDPDSAMTFEHPAVASAPPDHDMAHYHYDFGHNATDQPMFLTHNAMDQHAAMHPMQDFDYHSNMAFQSYSQPNFIDPWQQQQQHLQQQQQHLQHQQHQQSMHLNSIGPNARFSRTNMVSQALHRASDARAARLQNSHESSTDTTPDSDASAGDRGKTQGSSVSSMSTMLSPGQTCGPMSAIGMYTAAVMPNNFAPSFGQTSAQQDLRQPSCKSSQNWQQQQQQPPVRRDDNTIAQSQTSTPSHPGWVDATFNVTHPYHNINNWTSGLLEQEFITNDPSNIY